MATKDLFHIDCACGGNHYAHEHMIMAAPRLSDRSAEGCRLCGDRLAKDLADGTYCARHGGQR